MHCGRASMPVSPLEIAVTGENIGRAFVRQRGASAAGHRPLPRAFGVRMRLQCGFASRTRPCRGDSSGRALGNFALQRGQLFKSLRDLGATLRDLGGQLVAVAAHSG